jgi:hypothetical protein
MLIGGIVVRGGFGFIKDGVTRKFTQTMITLDDVVKRP